MNHPFVDYLIEQARRKHSRVAVPDACHDMRVLTAVCEVQQKGWLDLVLTGPRRQFEKLATENALDIEGIEIVDPDTSESLESMCETYARLRAKEALTKDQIREVLRDPLYFACMLHRDKKVDGICSGIYYSTAQLARASIKTLGMQPGVSKMTALAVILFDHSALGDHQVFLTADGTILPRPSSEELAEIAMLAADRAKVLLPDKPRVAMLSFSTCGSAQHEEVDRVVKALEMVRRCRPDICIDGEFQIDAALSPYVAEKKVKRPSDVAGRANVLIWPDLQTGNMAGKGMMLMANGKLAGATFLGVNGFVNDHSRGATVEEVVINIAFVGAQVD